MNSKNRVEPPISSVRGKMFKGGLLLAAIIAAGVWGYPYVANIFDPASSTSSCDLEPYAWAAVIGDVMTYQFTHSTNNNVLASESVNFTILSQTSEYTDLAWPAISSIFQQFLTFNPISGTIIPNPLNVMWYGSINYPDTAWNDIGYYSRRYTEYLADQSPLFMTESYDYGQFSAQIVPLDTQRIDWAFSGRETTKFIGENTAKNGSLAFDIETTNLGSSVAINFCESSASNGIFFKFLTNGTYLQEGNYFLNNTREYEPISSPRSILLAPYSAGWHHWNVTYSNDTKLCTVFQDGVLLGTFNQTINEPLIDSPIRYIDFHTTQQNTFLFDNFNIEYNWNLPYQFWNNNVWGFTSQGLLINHLDFDYTHLANYLQYFLTVADHVDPALGYPIDPSLLFSQIFSQNTEEYILNFDSEQIFNWMALLTHEFGNYMENWLIDSQYSVKSYQYSLHIDKSNNLLKAAELNWIEYDNTPHQLLMELTKTTTNALGANGCAVGIQEQCNPYANWHGYQPLIKTPVDWDYVWQLKETNSTFGIDSY